jgi:hypothetical protein
MTTETEVRIIGGLAFLFILYLMFSTSLISLGLAVIFLAIAFTFCPESFLTNFLRTRLIFARVPQIPVESPFQD